MFYAALTFAFGALSPVLPAPSVAIATCFAPEEICNAFAVDAVDGADREILVSAYSLTSGSRIILEALVRARSAGSTSGLCGQDHGANAVSTRRVHRAGPPRFLGEGPECRIQLEVPF